MFCTTCEMVVEDLSHYRSQIHAINIRRKLSGYPPLSAAELDQGTSAGGFMVDLYHNHDSSSSEPSIADNSTVFDGHCLFCNEPESFLHYLSHGIEYEEAAYIKDYRCYVCYEKFVSKSRLLNHLKIGKHRTAMTDGTVLYLENGSVLYPPRRKFNVIILRDGSSRISSLKPFVYVPRASRHSKLSSTQRYMRSYGRIRKKKSFDL